VDPSFDETRAHQFLERHRQRARCRAYGPADLPETEIRREHREDRERPLLQRNVLEAAATNLREDVRAKRALAWYTDVLGFTVRHHVPEAGWAELQTPIADVRVGLTEVEEMPVPGGGAVLTFNVRDVDASRRYLESRDDVRFDGDTCTIEGWVRLATVFDPDGNPLMLAQSLVGAGR
jgi:catechol 2,3-dioxygenase-like lactoylglutathione lyase family enzyme